MRPISQFVRDFINIFTFTTRNFRKILKYLQSFARSKLPVFPSVETISKSVGCCIRTVVRATNYFQQMGWVCKIKRGYQSNVYFVNDEIAKLNLNDPNLFKMAQMSLQSLENAQVLNSTPNTSHEGTGSLEKKENINPILDPLPMSSNDKQRLSANFKEFQLAQALDDAKFYLGKGNKIKNWTSFLWSRAKKAVG